METKKYSTLRKELKTLLKNFENLGITYYEFVAISDVVSRELDKGSEE